MKPFLKWAGGKYRIIDKIISALPKKKTLIEPFVGSGAVFLNTEYENYILADTNTDLISLYLILQEHGIEFIRFTESLFSDTNNHEKVFYELRNEFNITKDVERKAAIFVYLNRHCFNGLCRYNSKGEFNVPFGRYSKPYFPFQEMLSFHEKSKNAEFKNQDFRVSMKDAKGDCVVYCDPPYAPLTLTANFSSYTKNGFNQKDQEDLALLAHDLSKKNIPFVISNHDTVYTRNIYSLAKINNFDVQRFIASKAANRIKAAELVATYG